MVRFKNRYLLAQILFPSDLSGGGGDDEDEPANRTVVPQFSEANLANIIRESVVVNFGDTGSAQLGSALSVKYLSRHTRIAIIRASRSASSMVWQSLTFLRQIKAVDCCVRVIHVGGTIRKTQQMAIRYNRMVLLKRIGHVDGNKNNNKKNIIMKQIEEEKALSALDP